MAVVRHSIIQSVGISTKDEACRIGIVIQQPQFRLYTYWFLMLFAHAKSGAFLAGCLFEVFLPDAAIFLCGA